MSLILSGQLIGKKMSVTDEYLLLNPLQIPLVSALGFSEDVTQTKHEWYEDAMFPTETVLSTTVDADDTGLVVESTECMYAGAVLKIEDELVKVTSVTNGTTAVMVRGFAGTTAAAHTASATMKVKFMYPEGVEGRTAREARAKQRVAKDNYTQIFDETIEVSGTAAAVLQHGIDSVYENQKMKKLAEKAFEVEQALINGVKYTNGTDVRTFQGLRSFIATNVVNASNADITIDMIDAMASAVYAAGGFKNGGRYVLMMPHIQRKKLASLNSDKVVISNDYNKVGRVVTSVISNYGEFPVLINPNLDATEVFLIDLDRIKIRPLRTRNFFHEYLGKTGDNFKGMIVGELTVEMHQELAHARIKGLKTT